MSTPSPPCYVVQSANTAYSRRRRWLWLGLIWLLSVLVIGAGVYLATARGPLASVGHGVRHQLQKENQTLHKQVVGLTRSLQVYEVATHSLQNTLAEREEKINGLRADLTFYSHLIGGGSQHQGLRVQDVHLTRVGQSRAWNITVTLTHNVRRGSEVKGAVSISVEGILKGHLIRLDWAKLGGKASQDGLGFNFRYFQQVRGTLMLPPDFVPNRLRIEAKPVKGKSVVHRVNWSTALKSVEDNDVQQ